MTMFAAAALVTLAGLLALLATDRRELAFTLGVVSDRVAVGVEPGQTACQTPIDGSAPFDEVRLIVGTHGRPGPPLSVLVRDAGTGRQLATGRLEPGYADNTSQTVRVRPRAPIGALSVCVRPEGPIALYGGASQAARSSDIVRDGSSVGADMSLVFLREDPKPALQLVPDVVQRAALFHPRWDGAWFMWLLGAAVVLLVPLLLALSLRAVDEPEP